MWRIFLVFGFCLFSTSHLLAGTYQIIHQEVVPGAEGIVDLDPIISESGEFAGLLLTDSLAGEVSIIHPAHNLDTVLQLHKLAKASAVYVDGDSTIVYTLSYAYGAWISRHVLLPESVMSDSIEPYYRTSLMNWAIPQYSNLEFIYEDGKPTFLIFGQTVRHHFYEFTMGPSEDDYNNCALYSLDLRTELARRSATFLRVGSLDGLAPRDIITFSNMYHYHDYCEWPYPAPGCYGRAHWVEVGARDSTTGTLFFVSPVGGVAHGLWIDDYNPYVEHDEILYTGCSADLTKERDSVCHSAMYTLSGSHLDQLWYRDHERTEFSFPFRSQHYLAGIRRNNEMVALNYLSGTLTDSVMLDRPLADVKFFETGNSNPVLNLVGRHADTVFVYAFDTPTDVDSDENPTLPTSTHLHQNYPNPFNSSTVVTFALDKRQAVRIDVVNILGQTVATLVDDELPAGEHALNWDGETVGSGVYFIRLTAADHQQSVKALLLK